MKRFLLLLTLVILLAATLSACGQVTSAGPVPLLEAPNKAREAVRQMNERTKSLQQTISTTETNNSQ